MAALRHLTQDYFFFYSPSPAPDSKGYQACGIWTAQGNSDPCPLISPKLPSLPGLWCAAWQLEGFTWEAGDANSGLSPKDCSRFSTQCNLQMHKLAYPAASCPAIFAASCLCLTLASPKTLKYSPAKKEKEGKECFHTNSPRTHT